MPVVRGIIEPEERTTEAGFALVTALIVTTLLAAAGITLNRTAGLNARMAADRTMGDQAYYTADACVQAALYALKGNPSLRGSLVTNAVVGPGSCSVTVSDSPSPQGDILIAATGTVGTATRTIEKRYFPPAFQTSPPQKKDTYIYEGDWKKNYGIATRLKVGPMEKDKANRALLSFNLRSIPAGSVVYSAKLELYFYDHDRKKIQNNHLEVEVHRVTHNWKEGNQDGAKKEANWRKRKKNRDWWVRGGDFDSNIEAMTQVLYGDLNQWVEWDITSLAQYWIDNSSQNFGMILKDDFEGTEGNLAKKEIFEARFRSSEYFDLNFRPKLTVIYMTP